MTPKKKKVLIFLSDKMEATAKMIGHHVIGKNRSHSTRSAAALLGFLREQDYVMRLPELKAWRLTAKGREWVSQSNGDQS